MERAKAIKIAKNTKKYSLCIVGAGHVGLVAAACFAELGHRVVCVDSDPKKIQALKRKSIPFYEPDLEALVRRTTQSGALCFTASLSDAIKRAEIIFLAVGTPSQEDGSADLAAVENVARVIAANLSAYKLVVEKSTVPVQTGVKVKEVIQRYKKTPTVFDVASNPEFLREGNAIYDFFYPDRIVIGVESKRAEKILKDIYAPLKAPLIVTDINTAELIKHASNSFLATKISFINAVAQVCDRAGADVTRVAEGMGFDKRIGRDFLKAGIGYGGSCFPKDVAAFIYISKKLGCELSLLKEVEAINARQRQHFVEKVKERLWILREKKLAILGLSFKPDTDDLRSAPAIDIINAFLKEGARLRVYDPQAMPQAKRIFRTGQITFAKNPYEAVWGCDCACFLTEWEEFKKLNFKRVRTLMHYPLIADGRNMFCVDTLRKLEFDYIGIGR